MIYVLELFYVQTNHKGYAWIYYLLVSAVCIREESWIPVQVEHIIEPQDWLIIDPEHTIVKHGSTVRIKV